MAVSGVEPEWIGAEHLHGVLVARRARRPCPSEEKQKENMNGSSLTKKKKKKRSERREEKKNLEICEQERSQGPASLQPLADVVVHRLRVSQQVLRLVQGRHAALPVEARGDDGLRVGAVPARLPEHGPAQALCADEPELLVDARDGVVRDDPLRGRVLRVRGARDVVVLLDRARQREHLVVVDAVLPRPGTHARGGLAEPRCALERAPVERNAHDDLARGDARGEVVVDGAVGGKGGRARVGRVRVQVGLVASAREIPAPSVVVRHDVEVVENLAHLLQAKVVVVGWASWHGRSKEELVPACCAGGIGVELGAHRLEKLDEVVGISRASRVLPVNVDAVKAPVLDESDRGLGKVSPGSLRGSDGREVGRPGPAADGKNDFEVAVVLFDQSQLLDSAVGVRTNVVPC